ncbi:uncharacterized protein BJ212DRAFT_1388503, partial [Suillus subaureus]
MSGLESLYALEWNNNISVAIITLISYDYMLQLEKEITFVWVRAQPKRYQDATDWICSKDRGQRCHIYTLLFDILVFWLQ